MILIALGYCVAAIVFNTVTDSYLSQTVVPVLVNSTAVSWFFEHVRTYSLYFSHFTTSKIMHI